MKTTIRDILVADDDAMTLFMLLEGLSNNGYDILTAENGLMAEQLIQSNNFDLLIMDHQMPPGPTGIELCSKYSSSVQVIIISGDDVGDEAIAAGASEFILRPVTPGELLTVISNL